MDCKKALLLLPAYYDKQLEAPDRIEFENHIHGCPVCLKKLATIEELDNAIHLPAEITLPLIMAQEILSSVRRSAMRYRFGAIKRFFFIRRRSFYQHMVSFSRLAVVLVIALGLLKVYFMFTAAHDSGNRKSQTITTPLIQYPPKNKNAEQGVESLPPGPTKHVAPAALPEIVKSNKPYTRSTIEDAMINPDTLKQCEQYTIAEVAGLQAKLVEGVAKRARFLGENGTTARQSVRTALSLLEKPALPVYMEKAKFEDKDVWLVTLIWNTGSPSQRLTKVSIFAIDPVKNTIVYTQ